MIVIRHGDTMAALQEHMQRRGGHVFENINVLEVISVVLGGRGRGTMKFGIGCGRIHLHMKSRSHVKSRGQVWGGADRVKENAAAVDITETTPAC
jgi:hypothetical protein